jgi:predicted RNase H-like HicB family nuclease
MLFHVTLEHANDGWIVAECPALPGCVSQGRDEKEARENIKETMTSGFWAEYQKALWNDSSKKGRQPNDVELP